jgi:hypothetical protein
MNYDEESFERGQALHRQSALLPAAAYNLTRVLLANSARACVFVPIRSMQYLAVIDADEIIFVDSQYKRWVEVAWQAFKPQSRTALDQPVEYRAVFYVAGATETQRRLQRDFHQALELLGKRQRPDSPARVLSLQRGKPTEPA